MSRVFIIAEAGVNHNGDESLAMRLIEIAASCGADAIKFQTFSADKLVVKGTAKATYQARETGIGDQHSMLRALEMSDVSHLRIAEACGQQGIEFMSTPFDECAAEMLLDLGMRRIKVPSGELTNLPFLRFLAGKRVPLIISTGMADMEEVHLAVKEVKAVWSRIGYPNSPNGLTVLHCTSNYPAEFSDVNLFAMQSICKEVGVNVGYSDHTLGIAVSTAAVALGAKVIEKHFTLDKSLTGPDHSTSLNPDELKALVDSIRVVEQCLGSTTKSPTSSELPIRDLVRRSVTLLRDFEADETIGSEDVALMRPGSGIQPADINRVLGRQTRHALTVGTTLKWSDLK